MGQLLQVRLAQLCAEQQTQWQESGPCQGTTRAGSLVTPPPAAITPPAFCPWCDLTGRGQHALVDTPSNSHTVGLIALLMVMIHPLAMNSGFPKLWLLYGLQRSLQTGAWSPQF